MISHNRVLADGILTASTLFFNKNSRFLRLRIEKTCIMEPFLGLNYGTLFGRILVTLYETDRSDKQEVVEAY